MRKLVIAISMLSLAASAAFADPILDRQGLMKERGKIVGGLSKIAKGEADFDAAAVLTALQALQVNA
jgi:cytochrome c556